MKKFYMLIIIIFSLFVISDVNALENFSLSDFVLSDSINFSNQPATKTGTSLDWNGTELNNLPTNDYNYIVLTLQSFIMYNETNTNSGNTYGYASGNIIHCNPYNSNTPSSSYTCDYTITENNYMQQETHQVLNLTIYGYINYDNGGQHNCMYDGSNFVCPYEKGKRIINVSFKVANMSYGVNMSARVGITYFYANLINSQSIINSIDNQTDIISNDDTSGNASGFSSDINNFNIPNDSHAFDILGSLNNFIGNIQVSGACSRISVPIPFTDKNFVLPCMTTDVYSVHFREIVVIWQLICRGVGYYYILVNVLKLVKETLDPFNFKLEVLDL